MKVTADTKVADALRASKKVVKVFSQYNLDCATCKGSVEDSVEKAAVNYGLDLKALLKDINEAIRADKAEK